MSSSSSGTCSSLVVSVPVHALVVAAAVDDVVGWLLLFVCIECAKQEKMTA